MKHLTDQQLLAEYCRDRSDSAFAELVARHVDLVYSAASRIVQNAATAQDITQNVFLAMANNAPRLRSHPVLAGWLHSTTHHLAANSIRTDVRRQAREKEAVLMHSDDSAAEPVWEEIAPHLDTALNELPVPDRDALILRFFQQKSAREIGNALKISEEAAQKRLSRALEKLRIAFANRGLRVGTTGLAAVLGVNAVQSAPMAVSTAVTIGATAAAVGTTTHLATQVLAMTTLQKILVSAALVGAVGVAVYQTNQSSQLRRQLRDVQQSEGAALSRSHQQLADASNNVAALQEENRRLRADANDALRLRNDVTRLRAELKAGTAAQPKAAAIAKPPAAGQPLLLPKNSWENVGFATPEDALKTRGWSILHGDRDRFKESLYITDEARTVMNQLLDKMISSSPNPEEAKAHIQQNNLTLEDGLLFPMMADNRDKPYTGYQILEQQSANPDEAFLTVETQRTGDKPRQESFHFRRIDGTWKIVVDEAFLREQMNIKD